MFWTDSLTGLDSMKKTTFLRKLNFLIALGGIFAAVAFYGCGNLFSSIDSASDSPANFAQPREGYGIVSGSLPSSEKITVYLGDEQVAAVVRSKISKKKLQQKAQEETE